MNHKKKVFLFFLQTPDAIRNKTNEHLYILQGQMSLNNNQKNVVTSKKKVGEFFKKFPLISYNNGATSLRELNSKINKSAEEKKLTVKKKQQFLLFFQQSPQIIIIKNQNAFATFQNTMKKRQNSPKKKIINFLKDSPKKTLEVSKIQTKDFKVMYKNKKTFKIIG